MAEDWLLKNGAQAVAHQRFIVTQVLSISRAKKQVMMKIKSILVSSSGS